MDIERRRAWPSVVGLLLLAPFVGEFLLGNVPISQLLFLVLLVPLYGAGALLIRETARRLGRGWPTIVVLAAAYALVEEAIVDQMVFNPGYLGLRSFAGFAEIPGLHASLLLILYSLALHTVWSICVPIALVEAFDPTPTRPWLPAWGWVVVGAGFVAGCIFLGVNQARELDFVASPLQFTVSAVVVVALVAIGLALRTQPAARTGRAPRPWLVGVVAFAATSAYWLCSFPADVWWGILANLVVFFGAAVVASVVVVRWSRRAGWGPRHRLALAAGAAATYATWFGLTQAREAGTPVGEALLGWAVSGVVAALVVVLGWRSVDRAATARRTRLG